MATFHGQVYEYPGLFVDRYTSKTQIHLLTHFHADHLVGLEHLRGTTYCSETTARLLASLKYAHVPCKPLAYGIPHAVVLNQHHLTITLVPLVHCAGLAMFLVEGPHNVLATGDLRAEPWWVALLSQNIFLFPYISGQRQLHAMYLDTSFMARGEPYIDVPANGDGTAALAKLLQAYPQDDEILYHFLDLTLGFDEAWALVMGDGARLHASAAICTRIGVLSAAASAHGARLDRALRAKHGRRFHACGRACVDRFSVRIAQCVDLDVRDYAGVCMPVPLHGASLVLIGKTSSGTELHLMNGRDWLVPPGGTELLPCDVKLVYSRHSSYRECADLVRILHPRQVYPCVATKKTWKQGGSMHRLFGCDSVYDKEMEREFGAVSAAPVRVVNPWVPTEIPIRGTGPRKDLTVPVIKVGQLPPVPGYKGFSLLALVALRHTDLAPFIRTHQARYAVHNVLNTVRGGRAPTPSRLGGASDSDTSTRSSDAVAHRLVVASSFSSIERSVGPLPRRPRALAALACRMASFSSRRPSPITRPNSRPSSFCESPPSSVFYECHHPVDTLAVDAVCRRLQKDPTAWLSMGLSHRY